LRLKDLLGPVTRVKKKRRRFRGYVFVVEGLGVHPREVALRGALPSKVDSTAL